MINMYDILNKRLNKEETIQSKMPDIISAFIEFYGEENKDKILTKLNNMILICTISPESLKYLLHELKKAKNKNLIQTFLNQTKIEYQNIENKIFINNNFEALNKNILNKIIKDEKQNEIYQIYKTLLKQYSTFIADIKPYEIYIKKCKKLKKTIQNKYLNALIQKYKYLFTEEELNEYNLNGQISKKMYLYFGNNLNVPSIIESFSKDSNLILNNPHAPKWQKISIQNDRIKYYKQMNIDLGNDYKEYQKSLNCISVTPNQDLIEEIILTKEYFEMKMYNDYYTSLPQYIQNEEKIKNLNLLSSDSGYNAGTFIYQKTYVTPNLKKINNKYIEMPLVNINFDEITDFTDNYIIHELNHVYELNLLNLDQNGALYICGWDTIYEANTSSNNLYPLKTELSNRNYEAFNEIINELITEDIMSILHKNNVYMFTNKEKAQNISNNIYQNTKFLAQTFYNEFKDEIIKSRNGNIEYIFNACGKENFENLNQLFNEFNKHWIGTNAIKLFQELEANVKNENTQKFQEILKKRDIILKQMLEYKKNQKGKNK